MEGPKYVPYSSPYPKPNSSLMSKFDMKYLNRNRLAVYGKRTICEFQDITAILHLYVFIAGYSNHKCLLSINGDWGIHYTSIHF